LKRRDVKRLKKRRSKPSYRQRRREKDEKKLKERQVRREPELEELIRSTYNLK
jgi:hypothetical protein